MLESCESPSTMKNPEHESGYFEDGSDVETTVETTVEKTIVPEERKHGSACYGLAKAIHSLDVRDSSEPVSDDYEDRFNRGTDALISSERYRLGERSLLQEK